MLTKPPVLVGAFSVITNLRMELFEALAVTVVDAPPASPLVSDLLIARKILLSLGRLFLRQPS